jgi:hypothetical protein
MSIYCTKPLLFYSNAAERMRLDSSGNLLVGTTSVYNSARLTIQKSVPSSSVGGGTVVNILNDGATSTTRLHNLVLRAASNANGADVCMALTDSIAYNYFFGGNNGTLYCLSGITGGVGLTQGATSWSSLSDATMKNVIGTYTTPLADIAKLEAVKFTWKADAENKSQVGVIAQSVLPVVPEAIDIDDKGILSVRYTELIPLLVASIQELKAELDVVKAELVTLKAK